MANVKITDLGAYTNPVSTDVLPIVDVSADSTKKVSIADLLENAGSGTAAAPGIAFDGDGDTGIYRPGANQVAISTNGAERARIDSSGRLLVGTSTSLDATSSIQTYKASGTNTILSETGSLGNDEATRLLVKCSSPLRFGQFAVAKHSGITNPVAYLELNQEDSNQSFFWFDNSAVARTSPTFAHVGTTSGTVIGTQTSDERMKNVGNNVTYGLAEIKQLQPKQYSLKTEPDVNKLGFIAQDVELIIPEAVYDTAVELKGHQDGDRTMLSMEYVQLIPVLVNAVKELSAEVDALKAQLQFS